MSDAPITLLREAGRCSTCTFWDELRGVYDGKPVGGVGACRRNAPRIQELDPAKVPDTVISGLRPGIWPLTRLTDWCGDFKVARKGKQ